MKEAIWLAIGWLIGGLIGFIICMAICEQAHKQVHYCERITVITADSIPTFKGCSSAYEIAPIDDCKSNLDMRCYGVLKDGTITHATTEVDNGK